MISTLQWHSLVQKKPRPSSWASPQRIKATFIAVVLPMKHMNLQHASICINMPSLPKTSPFSILHLFLHSKFFITSTLIPLSLLLYLENGHGIWTCSRATSLPQSLPRKVWMHMGPATKRAHRFLRPEATELNDLNVSFWWIMGICIKGEKWLLFKLALKVSCLWKVLDVFFSSTLLTWKLLLACERQTACSSQKQRISDKQINHASRKVLKA